MAVGSLSRVLVTGGAGFIGRRVAGAPQAHGHAVTSVDKHASAGKSMTVNDIVAAVRVVTRAELPVEHVPPKPGATPAVIVDISAARSLGYEPQHDLKAGIATVWPEFSETAK